MSDNFNFWVPAEVDLVKSGDGKSKMRIRGFASTADEDTDEEVLEPSGFVLDRLLKSGYFNYDHRARENPMYIVGEPDVAKIVDNKLYVEGELYDTPLARDIWEFGNVLKKSNSKRRLGFSIEGKALLRDPFNTKRITKALLTGIAITPAPKNVNALMDVMKGNTSTPFMDYEFEEQESIFGDDVIFEKVDEENGVAYSIGRDFVITKKSINSRTEADLIMKSIVGTDVCRVKSAIALLTKAMETGKLSGGQIKRFKNLLDKIHAIE